MRKRYSEDFKLALINRYKNGEALNPLCKEFRVAYSTAQKWLVKYNVPSNGTGRFEQEYQIYDTYATIRIRKGNSFVYALIDIEDVDRCKKLGIWSLTYAGYVINYQKGIYLHRFVMNCPQNLEVDHIYHNLLDNRKSQLRLATASQQIMNTHIRVDNTSGHRGVYWDKARNTWNININTGSNHFRKRFNSYEEACEEADAIYEKYFNDFQYKELLVENNLCLEGNNYD